jgi:hypothetical protein
MMSYSRLRLMYSCIAPTSPVILMTSVHRRCQIWWDDGGSLFVRLKGIVQARDSDHMISSAVQASIANMPRTADLKLCP